MKPHVLPTAIALLVLAAGAVAPAGAASDDDPVAGALAGIEAGYPGTVPAADGDAFDVVAAYRDALEQERDIGERLARVVADAPAGDERVRSFLDRRGDGARASRGCLARARRGGTG